METPEIQLNFTSILILTFVFILLFIFIIIAFRIFTIRIISEQKIQFEKHLIHQKELAIQRSQVQEQERKLIASKLHDEVGSQLNTMQLWVENEETWKSGKVKEIFSQMLPTIITDVRNISHSLYPVILESLGLVSAVEEIQSNLKEQLDVHFTVRYGYNSSSLDTDLQIYRIAQEFISNTIKHSRASSVEITIRDTKYMTCILLFDNGIGFNFKEEKKGLGLKNITARLHLLNATYKWKNTISIGTRLIILLDNGRTEDQNSNN